MSSNKDKAAGNQNKQLACPAPASQSQACCESKVTENSEIDDFPRKELLSCYCQCKNKKKEFLCSVDETILLDCDADCDTVKQKETEKTKRKIIIKLVQNEADKSEQVKDTVVVKKTPALKRTRSACTMKEHLAWLQNNQIKDEDCPKITSKFVINETTRVAFETTNQSEFEIKFT